MWIRRREVVIRRPGINSPVEHGIYIAEWLKYNDLTVYPGETQSMMLQNRRAKEALAVIVS